MLAVASVGVVSEGGGCEADGWMLEVVCAEAELVEEAGWCVLEVLVSVAVCERVCDVDGSLEDPADAGLFEV